MEMKNNSFQIWFIGDSLKFFSPILLLPSLLINLLNREMPKKKYKIRDIIDATFAVLTNPHFKEREFSSHNTLTKPITFGIISITCTVSKG